MAEQDGIVLSAEFVKSSPKVEAEVQRFFNRVELAKKELGFSQFVMVEEDLGERVIVRIIPSSAPVAVETPKEVADDQRSRLGLAKRTGAGPVATAPCPHSAMRVAEMFKPRLPRPSVQKAGSRRS